MKQILPPELQPYDRKRYVRDLEYRLIIDLKIKAKASTLTPPTTRPST